EIAIEGVSLVDYPHYFTPNGDGYHDTWNIIGLNQPDAKVYIFDRFGKLIKQISATDDSQGWDGTYNGTPLPATDYWFSVTYRELVNGEPVEKEFKAHFSLKR
uniref:T9SS type B sorting domain-containing protein n=1 Tax=Flavobacterium sp. TaxID=239 RepID=UPI003A92EFD9